MNVESAVSALEAHPDYKILRRFQPRDIYQLAPVGMPVMKGLYVDCETTGVDHSRDDIIELAIVPFRFTASHIVTVLPGHSYLNEPSHPLEDVIRRLTGITDEELIGKTLPLAEIAKLTKGVQLVVAHNAGFDRKFVERYVPEFKKIAWGCSQQDVPWKAVFDAPAAGLEVLALTQCGIFYDAHRAEIDCLVGLDVLARAEDSEGNTAFEYLLSNVQRESVRIWAISSPFHAKDMLKSRGYNWNDGKDGRPKAWHKTIDPADIEEEQKWLRAYAGAYPQLTTVEAVDRYSIRER